MRDTHQRRKVIADTHHEKEIYYMCVQEFAFPTRFLILLVTLLLTDSILILRCT